MTTELTFVKSTTDHYHRVQVAESFELVALVYHVPVKGAPWIVHPFGRLQAHVPMSAEKRCRTKAQALAHVQELLDASVTEPSS